jgi:hypothetical protein
LADVGDVRGDGSRSRRSLLIGALREASKPFVLEDLGDDNGAEGDALFVEGAADIVDREVLLAEVDDVVADGIRLGSGVWPLGGGKEEGTLGIPAEVVDQDPKASWGVAVAFGDLGTGEFLNEESTESFVLAVCGIAGFEENAGEVR